MHFEQGGDLLWLEAEGLQTLGDERSPFSHPARRISIQSVQENAQDGKEIVLRFYPDGTRTEDILFLTDAAGRQRWIEIGRSFAVLQVTPERPTDDRP